jgi:hypothetical protein
VVDDDAVRRRVSGPVLCLSAAPHRGTRLIRCEARSPAVPFHLKHDFEVEGPEFERAASGLPHQRMGRALD